jgi:hypothetical protein
MWYGIEEKDRSYDFFAEGDKGQIIYVSPPNNLVIVRNGVDYGISSTQWIIYFHQFAGQYK